MSSRNSARVWKSVLAIVLGATAIAFVRPINVPDDEPPIMWPQTLISAIPVNGVPEKAAPQGPTDGDVFALAGACSCDASSPAGERPPELEDYRTDHDTGDPVSLYNGMVSLRRTDLCLSGRGSLGFAFTRSYSSKAAPRTTGNNLYPLGQGWDHNYNLRLVLGWDPDDSQQQAYSLYNGSNRIDVYRHPWIIVGGQVVRDTSRWYAYGVYSELKVTESEIILRARHGTKTHFSPTGVLTRIEDRNGNNLSFSYDSNGRLSTIKDPMGRIVTLGYFSPGNNKEWLVHTISDPTGRTATLEYTRLDSGNDLSWTLTTATTPTATVVTDPSDSTFSYGWANGKTEGYLYKGFAAGTNPAEIAYNLTAVIAPRQCVVSGGVPTGDPYVQFDYGTLGTWREDWCVSQTLGKPNGAPATGGTITYAFDTSVDTTLHSLNNPNDVRMKTTVQDREGRETDYLFNERGNVLKITEHTTEQNVSSTIVTEFEYYWHYQNWQSGGAFGPDGELKKITYPNGTAEERTYLNTLNGLAPRWSQGDLDTVTTTSGSKALTRTFKWDPVYNLPWRVKDENQIETVFQYDYMEGSASAGANYVIDDMAAELWMTEAEVASFLGVGTCYSGLLQNADLNGDGQHAICRGNVVQKVFPPVVLSNQPTWGSSVQQAWETDGIQQGIYSLTYNGYGQVTSQTDPEENVTVFLYTPENDLDGDGTADPTGFSGSDTVTGGFLKRVVRDTGLPYSDGQLTGVPARSLPSDIGRDSTFNPPTKSARTDLAHNLRGNLVSTTNPRGVKTEYWVNELDEVWRVAEAGSVSPSGRASAWDGSDETTSSQFGAISDIVKRWRYDANGMIIESQRRNTGNLNGDQGSFAGWLEQTFTYDLLNRMLTKAIERDSAGHFSTWSYTYNSPGDDLIDELTEPEGNKTDYTYTSRGQVKKVERGATTTEAGTTTYSYDERRNLVSVKDANDHTTGYSYDGFNRLEVVTDPLGSTTTYAYDDASNVTSVVTHGVPAPGQSAVNLTRVEYKYDERNRLYQVDRSAPSGQAAPVDGSLTSGDGKVTTRFDLDRVGRRIAMADDGGKVYLNYFDGMSNLAKTTDPLANTVENYFDDSENLVKAKQTDVYPGGSTRVFETFNIYDALNRVSSTTNNAGDTHRFTYDSRDNLVASSDAQNPNNASAQINGRTVNQPGNTRSYRHNGFDQVVQEVLDLQAGGVGGGGIDTSNPSNLDGTVTIVTAYDAAGRLLSRTDDRGKPTSYEYDGQGRVKKQTFADSTHQDYLHDPVGNLTKVTDARGNINDLTYDSADRLTQVLNSTQATGTIGTRLLTFEYDGIGRRTKSVSSDDLTIGNSDDQVVSRTYDALSRILTDSQSVQGGAARTVTNTWKEESKRATQTYPSGQVIAYTYDELRRVKTVRPSFGILTTYTYAGYRLHDRTYSNGHAELHHDANLHTDANYYDDAGRPIKLDYVSSGGTLLTSFEHAFDRMGNRKYERRLHDSNKGDNYTYDSLYRLTSFEREVPAANVGNPGQSGYTTRKDYQLDGVQNWMALVTNGGTPQTNAVNSTEGYTAFGSATPSYDADGNLTSPDSSAAQPITLKYDFLNRLREIVQGTQVVDHFYDAEGRRVRTTHNLGTATTIVYIYDGWEVVEEYDGSANLTRKWIMGRDVDEPLQMTIPTGLANAGTYDFQRSTLGNIVALTNTSGTVLERYTYDAYGTPQFENPSNANQSLAASFYGNPYLFNGRRYDPWIYPMYEYRTRMYSPALGRFVQRDSIGVWGDALQFGNPFGFLGCNPGNWRDPMGMEGDGISIFGIVTLPTPEQAWNAVKATASEVGDFFTGMAGEATGIATDLPLLADSDWDPYTHRDDAGWEFRGGLERGRATAERAKDYLAKNWTGIWLGMIGPGGIGEGGGKPGKMSLGNEMPREGPSTWDPMAPSAQKAPAPPELKPPTPEPAPAPKGTSTGGGGYETPTNTGQGQAPKSTTPNSIYEQYDQNGNLRSRSWYDENGHWFCREDYDHPHGPFGYHEHYRRFDASGRPITKETVDGTPR